jgi:hypothetical protein
MMPPACSITAMIGSADQALRGFDPLRSSLANDTQRIIVIGPDGSASVKKV